MKIAGGLYIFSTRLQYNRKYNNKMVTIEVPGDMVSKVRTEDGKTFAAFNSELTRDTRILEGQE